MSDAWTPDVAVDDELARRLIGAQFPALADASLRRIGQGWDNVAYLVAERYIFRFPQRKTAGPLMAREIKLLPHLTGALPIAIPRIQFAGAPQDEYPWHFAGYEILLGRDACVRPLSDEERGLLATDLGRVLRALHDIDPQPLIRDGLPDDAALDGPLCVVHGDLYARHLLFNERGKLSAIIDWGDLHYGNAAADLMCLYLMIPPQHHAAFFEVYGAVDDRTLWFARARARHHASYILDYAAKVGDEALHRSAEIAREFLSPAD